MVDLQESQFRRTAIQSGLLDAAAIDECFAAIPEENRTAEAIDRRLARQSVNIGLLTVWQAQQMLSGRTLGFKVDKYVLLDLIGQGGMGRVYLAQDTRLGRRVALKVLSRERMNNPRAIARFQREAKVGAQLQHENLVRVYDEGQAQGVRYLVMEYIEGKNVGQLLAERGAIPWAVAARIGREVALGLEHAHRKGLIHRDVNPCNIVVTLDGTAKLTDLGLAIDKADEGNVTRDGATVGTFDYVSPEQARNSHSVDARADLYSLGCTLYHMLVGQVPFPLPSLPEKLYAHQMLDPQPIRELAPSVPEGLADAVARLMRKQPDDRPGSLAEVADALEPYISGQAAASAVATGSHLTSQAGSAGVGAGAAYVTGAGAGANAEAGTVSAGAVDSIPAVPGARPGGGKGGVSGNSDPDLGTFDLDFGPQLGLTEGLSVASKTKGRPKSASHVDDGPGRLPDPGKRPKAWVVGAGVFGVIAVVAALIFGLSRWGFKTKGKPPAGSSGHAGKGAPGAGVKPTPGAVGEGPAAVESGFSVRHPDGSTEAVADLVSAVNLAVGSRGEVLLGDHAPIRLSSLPTIRIQRGPLVIRAADNARPVLSIDDAGTQPLIETAGNAAITLRGLRIIARYPAKKAAAPAPLILAGGALSIDHCVFEASGGVSGATAIKGLGGALTVQGSLFDGFDKTLDLMVPPGSEITLRQSIFIKPRTSEEPLGWALRLQNETVSLGPNRNKPRKVTLDHCTTRGQGVFDLVEFGPNASIDFDVKASAFQAKSLIAWQAPANQKKMEPKSLHWIGRGNRFDVSGDAWIVLSTATASPAIPGAPTDLGTWSAQYTETSSQAASFTFAANPDTRPLDRFPEPADFALKGEGTADLGADPKRVGPEAVVETAVVKEKAKAIP